MPIQKSFCDAWYTACYNDYFCGQGSYFECAAYYEENQASKEEKEKDALVIGMSITGVLAAIGICFACFLVSREKRGKPVFTASQAATAT
jgi:hypothetical protein